jgi:hypothetical protein
LVKQSFIVEKFPIWLIYAEEVLRALYKDVLVESPMLDGSKGRYLSENIPGSSGVLRVWTRINTAINVGRNSE